VRIKGQLQVEFDEQCQYVEGGHYREQLTRIAEGKITRPGVDYRLGKDGKLVKLVDLLPQADTDAGAAQGAAPGFRERRASAVPEDLGWRQPRWWESSTARPRG